MRLVFLLNRDVDWRYPNVWYAWQHYGRLVGRVLSDEKPMGKLEIHDAARRLLEEEPELKPDGRLPFAYINHAISELGEADIVFTFMATDYYPEEEFR